MKTVTVNNRQFVVSGNILVYVDRLELSRHATVTWIDNDTCVITDNVNFDRPMTSLSSGYKTTIKEGAQ